VVEHDLAIDDDIREKDVPGHSTAGWRYPHERTEVSSCHGHASCDSVSLGDLRIDTVPTVGKGGSHRRMSLENLFESGVFFETREVMAIERFEKAANDSLVVFCRHI
jgi:hypothetical protein